MQIVLKKIADLKEYENNPRNNDGAVQAVANSIKEFGFKNPVIIDKNGIIVAGHTRVRAARSIGMDEVPCIVADDLTPEKIKAFRLADNKTAELAEWDFEGLSRELQELSEVADDLDMSQFGFAIGEYEDEPKEAAPAEFKEYGDDIKTENKCPMCGYEW